MGLRVEELSGSHGINCACGRVVAGWVFERYISLMSPSLQNRASGLLLVPILYFHGSTKLDTSQPFPFLKLLSVIIHVMLGGVS